VHILFSAEDAKYDIVSPSLPHRPSPSVHPFRTCSFSSQEHVLFPAKNMFFFQPMTRSTTFVFPPPTRNTTPILETIFPVLTTITTTKTKIEKEVDLQRPITMATTASKKMTWIKINLPINQTNEDHN
jgi:hypothetical protein